MPVCPSCGHENADPEARFCSRCGAAMPGAAPAPEEPPTALGPGDRPRPSPARRRKRLLWIILLADIPIAAAIVFFVLNGKGCGHAEGAFVAQGQPFGDFTFTPATCKSGQRMNFFGVILLGNGPTEGGILVGEEALQGKFVKVEIPGSCQPPDYEVCKEILVDRSRCPIFETHIERSNTTVNDIVLMDGRLKLQCQFPEGGTVKADIKFENCD